MSAREEILSLIQELGIEPKKSLGQNFLISDHVIQKITQTVEKLNPEGIVEIGPGLGALTRGLIQLNRPLFLIELDSVFANYWKEKGIALYEGDALHYDWMKLPLIGQVVLVSNLPYQISSSLVIDRSLDSNQLTAMVLMFQKEVAQRLKANRGHELYGMLSVVAQTFWDLELLLEASSGDFMPPPKVASRVLIFRKKDSSILDRQKYLQFVKGCFLHPRKLMISNLATALGLPKEKLISIFIKLKLNEKARAEELNLNQFIELYQGLGYK